MMKFQLTRDLRRQILRGHPWVYKEALAENYSADSKQAGLCRLVDKKGKDLAWAIHDPISPLKLRILTTESHKPNDFFYKSRFCQAKAARRGVVTSETTAYRLFNGEGDGVPGLVCDVYADVAVIQFDGEGISQFWDQQFIIDWLTENTAVKAVVNKTRNQPTQVLFGDLSEPVLIKENGLSFWVDVLAGQKTGFFLDQRENRNYLRTLSSDMSVLNLFSYTGGFSVYAGAGGSPGVTSVDLAKPAIELSHRNWELNSLKPGNHEALDANVFDFIESESRKWDIVIVDPPSMSSSEQSKAVAVDKYIDLFAKSGKLLKKQGHLILSSCSSHIGFKDFQEIVDETFSRLRKSGKIFRFSGQGSDHPYPNACPEMRYLKFVHARL